MIGVWVVLLVAGLTVSGLASGKALRGAEALGELAGLSPFVIGLTILSVGTDLPEIANSISAAAAGRGDVNVGDSTGSAATQITFVLGVLLLMRPLTTRRSFVAMTGSFMVGGLFLGAYVMADGQITRLDSVLLISVWIVGTGLIAWKARVPRTSQPSFFDRTALPAIRMTLVGLIGVAGGAVLAVHAFGRLTDELGVPEYVTAFFVLSIGTSLPELLIGGRAIRRGAGALALGDLLGSSFADATLSLAAGPLLFPTEVSASAASGTLIAGGVVAAAVALLLARTRHAWPTGVALLALYAALLLLLILQ